MDIFGAIKALLGKVKQVQRLKNATPLTSPVMDTVFTDRPQLPTDVVGVDVVNEVVEEMPLVRRGAPSISATQETRTMTYLEPLPIRPSVTVTGHELNILRTLNGDGLEAWIQAKTDYLRKAIRKTTEAMGATSLTGSLAWPVQLEAGGFDDWLVDFGSILTATPGVAYNNSAAKITTIFQHLLAMKKALQTKGHASSNAMIEIWAGETAYSTVLGLAEAHKSTAKMRVEMSEQGIDIAGFLMKLRAEQYKKPDDGSLIPIVAADAVTMVAKDAGHKLPYCALDDLDSGLQPLPFFIKPQRLEDPSGFKLIAESKPLPLVNVNGVCTATVIE